MEIVVYFGVIIASLFLFATMVTYAGFRYCCFIILFHRNNRRIFYVETKCLLLYKIEWFM